MCTRCAKLGNKIKKNLVLLDGHIILKQTSSELFLLTRAVILLWIITGSFVLGLISLSCWHQRLNACRQFQSGMLGLVFFSCFHPNSKNLIMKVSALQQYFYLFIFHLSPCFAADWLLSCIYKKELEKSDNPLWATLGKRWEEELPFDRNKPPAESGSRRGNHWSKLVLGWRESVDRKSN